jgi:hypothetical protein
VTLPVGVLEQDVAVGASTALVLESGASINGGIVLAMGPNGTVVPEGTSVGQVISGGPVEVGGTVSGDVLAEGSITLRNQGSIAGLQRAASPLGQRSATITQLVIPPSGTAGQVLLQGESRALGPGRYASLTVQTGGAVSLSTGDYFFDGPVIVEPGAQLVIEDAAGPVRLAVLDSVTYRGEITTASGRHPDLTLVGLGGRRSWSKGYSRARSSRPRPRSWWATPGPFIAAPSLETGCWCVPRCRWPSCLRMHSAPRVRPFHRARPA